MLASEPMTITNLTNEISLEIPLSGALAENYTLTCGYTTSGSPSILYDGLETSFSATSPADATCLTNHLTDFFIETYEIDMTSNGKSGKDGFSLPDDSLGIH